VKSGMAQQCMAMASGSGMVLALEKTICLRSRAVDYLLRENGLRPGVGMGVNDREAEKAGCC
jgi:hypothetical protein